MARMAYCGLDCGECPALAATLNDDQALRVRTAEIWSKEYDAEIRPEDVNCTGCTDPGEAKIPHCHECGIRLCALERPVTTCADCADYPCDPLEQFFQWVPSARVNLEGIRG